MKVLGLLFVIAIVVMGYCVYNPMVVDSADFTNTRTGKSASDGCKGPFGFDSQKALDISRTTEYMISVVSNIDLEKNPDGTWYVLKCELSNLLNVPLVFRPPYPQQNDLKDGDIIGVSGVINAGAITTGFSNGKILDHISSQAADCKIDGIKGLSTPAKYGERLGSVTGVVMAVEIDRNDNPEPDNPDDYQIENIVMKCADGNLYIVDLDDQFKYYKDFESIDKLLEDNDKNKGRYRILMGTNFPSHEAFGEGDVVTLEQINFASKSLLGRNYLSFSACYKKPLPESTPAKPLAQGNRSISAETYYTWGNTKYHLGDYKGAIADFDSAIRLKPDDAKAYYNRGVAKGKLGQHFAAIADYDTVIRLKPDHAEAYYNRGNAKAPARSILCRHRRL